MQILRTRVFPRVERDTALEVIRADMRRGNSVLFRVKDSPVGKISSCQRLSRALTASYPRGDEEGLPATSNYYGGYRPLPEIDVDALIKGLGVRFPTWDGFVMSVRDPEAFVTYFKRHPTPVDNNSYLPGEANVFSMNGLGTLAMSVGPLSIDRSLSQIENDEPRAPFHGKNWAFTHLLLDAEDREFVAAVHRVKGKLLKKRLRILAERVAARHTDVPEGPSGLRRVPLANVAKRQFKSLGYVWNKSESEPRITVFDKVTKRGNVIRITADAGGSSDVVPYVKAEFLSARFKSPPAGVVNAREVGTAEDLRDLLAEHADDVRYYDEHIAAIYDECFGECHPTVTRLIQDHKLRAIE